MKDIILHLVQAGIEVENGKVRRKDLPRVRQALALEKSMTGKEFVKHIKDILAKAGLPRLSTLAGGEISGWVPENHHGSLGFAVRKSGKDSVDVLVVVDGKKAGMRYREYEETDSDDETRTLHEPLQGEQDKVAEKIKAVLKKAGYDVENVQSGGYQMHWDYDTDFLIKMKRPPELLDK